jgi:hypothetical protein
MMRAIVDTNVAVTANGKSLQASSSCVRSCIERLLSIQRTGKIVLDSAWLVIREYKDNLSEGGQPGVGDAFLLWVLQNWMNPIICELHALEISAETPDEFAAFPDAPDLAHFDRSDRKFIALAVVSNTPIYTAVDSDFWDHQEALAKHQIQIEFVCPHHFD